MGRIAFHDDDGIVQLMRETTVKRWIAGMTCMGMLALANGAAAQSYNTRYYDVGDYSDVEGCWLEGDWNITGRSEISFRVTQTTAGDTYMEVSSYGWSRPAEDTDKVLGIVFRKPGQEDEIYVTFAAPLGSDYTRAPGMIGMLQDEDAAGFLSAWANSASFSLMTRDTDAAEGTRFDNILEGRLTGSADALASMQRCVRDVRRREDARRAREAEVEHIARDPFKPAG